MIHIETGKDNSILRNISEPITKGEYDQYIKIGREMIKYIKNPKNGGVGLAAPQIGHNKRLIVVSLLKDRDDESFPTLLMINPEIIQTWSECEIESEGCLSVPWENGAVERFKKIKLKFVDETKKEKLIILEWVSARIVQHEIDHLNGVLFTDKLVK